jgi:hypothetical protein
MRALNAALFLLPFSLSVFSSGPTLSNDQFREKARYFHDFQPDSHRIESVKTFRQRTSDTSQWSLSLIDKFDSARQWIHRISYGLDGKPEFGALWEFSSNGLLVRESEWFEDSTSKEIREYHYNPSNKITEIRSLRNGGTCFCRKFVFNGCDSLIESDNCRTETKCLPTEIRGYDDKCHLVRIDGYDDNGIASWFSTFQHDSSGRIVEESYHWKMITRWRWKFSYNTSGYLVRREFFFGNHREPSIETWEYDTLGRVVKNITGELSRPYQVVITEYPTRGKRVETVINYHRPKGRFVFVDDTLKRENSIEFYNSHGKLLYSRHSITHEDFTSNEVYTTVTFFHRGPLWFKIRSKSKSKTITQYYRK